MPPKDKYRLLRDSDPNDYIEFEVDSNAEDPCVVALEQLGWILVALKDEESH
jgi:hypothetical protein